MIRFEPLPPRQAIRAFLARGNRLDETFAWQDAWQEIHATMFTVAKSTGYNILGDIYSALLSAIEEGKTVKDFTSELEPILRQKGWWGKTLAVDPITGEQALAQLGSPRRLELIFDVNMRVSYAQGKWAGFEKRKVDRPFLRYVALLDDVTRPAHRARHNLVLPVDHPYWNIYAPPNGWNCRCDLMSLSERDVERLLAEGEDLYFEAPEIEFVDWKNKRTGVIEKIPTGVDPGWGHNPGITGFETIVERLSDRQSEIERELRGE